MTAVWRGCSRRPPHTLSGKGGDHGGQAAPAIVNVMTHCNAGRLATVEHGTAISPIYAAHAAGLPVHVWVSETRPRNQGLLTAWELAEAGVPHTLIADNAAGLLLMQGKVDLVICSSGREIPIEERAADELGAGSVPVANPAFDVTPAALISGIISECGVAAADSLAQWR